LTVKTKERKTTKKRKALERITVKITEMIEANETFDGTFPFEPRFSTCAGFRMHYVDEGRGSLILCLHGEPTWGYLYREVIPTLAQNNRVIVPDYMGFGKSETPQNLEYTARQHTDNLEILIEELNLHDITLVVHDWGGQLVELWLFVNTRAFVESW
jgi:haloalkane dehalogenase